MTLQQQLGNIDIYLLDQILKERYDNCKKIIDVGCGGGRNLVYFLQNGYEVYGLDPNEEALNYTKSLAKTLAPNLPQSNFQITTIEDNNFPKEAFDLVICSAVLHFAQSPEHFDKMLRATWQLLKPNGYFFARLATSISIENEIEYVGNQVYNLPDGSQRFLVDMETLLDYTEKLKAQLYEPIKTTNVQNLRAMTTWCMRKN